MVVNKGVGDGNVVRTMSDLVIMIMLLAFLFYFEFDFGRDLRRSDHRSSPCRGPCRKKHRSGRSRHWWSILCKYLRQFRVE